MDDPSESLDLSQLHLTPDWVKQSTESNKYADYKGEGKGDRRDGKGGRGGRDAGGDFGGRKGAGPKRPDTGRKPPGDGRGGGPRPPGQGPGQRQGQRAGHGPGQRPGAGGGERGRGGDRDRRGGGNFRGRGRDQRERDYDRDPLPAGIEARFIAEAAGVESLARQIKATGRAYSVFDLAKLVLGARERYAVEFFKNREAGDTVGLFQCKLDNSLWLSRDDALRHALVTDRFSEFYRTEEVETDPPKGNFSVVAVCGMSGVVLGPPNHHDYQKDLTRLYQERFSNMHFEGYKRRVRMENDPETIEKWKAQKSKQTHFTYQKAPENTEPVVLKSQAEMERHCREHHLDDLVAAVDKAKVPGNIPAKAMAPQLLAILRRELDQQKRFPMNTVKVLCRQLEDQGLKFFKDEDDKKKKTTYVCRSRPRALQGASHLSERIRKIVGLVRDNPGINYSIVVSSMLPGQKISEATTKGGKHPATSAKAAITQAETADSDQPPSTPTSAPESPPPSPASAASPSDQTPTPDPTPASAEVSAPAPPVEAPSAVDPPATSAAPEASDSAALEPPASAETEPTAASETVTSEATAESESPVAEKAASEPEAGSPEKSAPEEAATEPTEAAVRPEPAVESTPPAEAVTAPEVEGPSEAEIAVLKDLRWLIREGYVVEYSSGAMRLARNHPPRKRPAKKKKLPAAIQPKPSSAATEAAPEDKPSAEATPSADSTVAPAAAKEAPTGDEPTTSAPPEPTPASEAASTTETIGRSDPKPSSETVPGPPSTQGPAPVVTPTPESPAPSADPAPAPESSPEAAAPVKAPAIEPTPVAPAPSEASPAHAQDDEAPPVPAPEPDEKES